MGLRQGEARGLQLKDVDFESGDIRITKQLQRIHGLPRLVEPQTVILTMTRSLAAVSAIA